MQDSATPPWTPPLRIVFAVATILSLFSTLQAYRLSTLSISEPMNVGVWRLLVLNSFGYWYVPAALTPAIFALAYRFPIESVGRVRTLLVYALGAVAFSLVHLACTMTVIVSLWPHPPIAFATRVQRIYLTDLDWGLMTYSAILGLSYALGYHHESQARAVKQAQLEASLAEARLRTLEAELHPHFLFNTLHAISTLIHTAPEKADRTLSRLSDLLRMTFAGAGSSRVSLHDELEFTGKYLEIEQTRFQDRLTVTYEIDPDTLDAAVPRLILQPLVENAIKHGIAPRSAPGIIRIAARKDGDTLRLEVGDNGAGLAGGRSQLHTGVGLSNTRARLEVLYGTDQSLSIADSRFGLTVELSFPFQHHTVMTEVAAVSR
jgi:two-component system, LytTR family, sensor kinase